MLEGNLLPPCAEILSNIIAITFIGTKRLSMNWLSQTFQVQHSVVHEALQWLQANNKLYSDIVISHKQLDMLSQEGIPPKVMALIHHEEDETAVVQEHEGYIDDGTETTGKAKPSYQWCFRLTFLSRGAPT